MNEANFVVVHDAMALTGEAPVWDARRSVLWWIDIQGQRLLGYRPASGPLAPIPLPAMPGLIAISSEGNLILGLESGLWHLVPERREFTRISDIEADTPNNRLNDGKPDADGRLWFGSMDKMGLGGAVGALYRRDTDGRVARVLPDITVPNAIAVSPGGETLYFANSPDQELVAFDLERKSGELSNRRVLARFAGEEKPDGACIDSEGGIWVAVIGGARVDRYLPDGTLDQSLAVPVSRPTMPAFGGDDLRTLFVTSQRRFLDAGQLAEEPAAGSLIATRVFVAGLPAFEMAITPSDLSKGR
ncbi:MAG TPA: SMP-30/gluconolactonase/LRE family protein [Devosiaceae bacterium]